MAQCYNDVLLFAHQLLAHMALPLLSKPTIRVQPLLRGATRGFCEVRLSLSRAQMYMEQRNLYSLSRRVNERKENV